MTTLYQDYINDLKDSLTSPLLIEVQTKHIEELKNNDSAFSAEDSYHNTYDKMLTNKNKKTTNVVIIDAEKGENTQILNAFYEKTNVALKNKLGINSLVKAGVYFATMGLGELVSKDITNKASELLGDNLDKVTKVFDNDWINEQINKKVTEKPANIVTDAVEDAGNTQVDKLNAKHQFGSELFISKNAKASLLELANNISEYHTPHQAMQFTLKLITALGLDAPKLIVINNPFNLDSASLSLLSLLFSHGKDLKEKGQHTNISVLFNYTEKQPYDEPANKNEAESESYNTCVKLKRLRHMVQRYGMLEKPGSSIPTPAIKSTTFVGRTNELDELIKAHVGFVGFHQENKDRKKISQWTLIKGEPGTGKTALINKHLTNIDEKSDALSHSQIKLRQLNQVGHSSEVTGLASLLQSIQTEAERLTQYYQANQNFVQEKITETSLTYKNSKADVKNLKDNRKGLFKLIKSATEFVVDVASLGTPYQAATSAIDTFTLDRKQLQTGVALQEENSTDKKQEQFNQLNMALRYLSNIAKVVDKKAARMPLLLFVDDLQWIDELTAEFILAHLLPAFPIELLFTARGSDSETSYKLAVEGQKHSPYKLALFDAAKLSTIKVNSEREPNNLVDNKLITVQPQIVIKGMGHKTLSELIELTYTNSSEAQTDTIASAVIKALSTEDITEATQVVTLFAIEALNLISDPAFYRKNELLTPLIVQPKKGVYEINVLKQQELTNTVENIFTVLRDAHTQAYTHDSLQDNTINHFTLSSYAVMEERLFIIGQYFNKYSDAAIFSLQLSALIGAPFDSELVRELISGLTHVNEEKYPELTPIKELLKNNSQQALSPEHLEVLEEVFEILKRFQGGSTKHQYHHGLFAVFLRQQVKYRLNELFNYQENTYAVNEFFSYCQKIIENKLVKFNTIDQPVQTDFEHKLYYLKSLDLLFSLAFEVDENCWVDSYIMNLSRLVTSYYSINHTEKAITIGESSLAISKVLFSKDDDRWAMVHSLNLLSLAAIYSSVGRTIESITLQETSLTIANSYYVKQSDLWAMLYTTNLINLASSYDSNGRTLEAIMLQEASLEITERYYQENNDCWAEFYTTNLINLASSYGSVGRTADEIPLKEASLAIRKKHYGEKKGGWERSYSKSLMSLASSYDSVGRTTEAIKLQEDSLEIVETLYAENNERWVEDYTVCLENLAASYDSVGRTGEAITLNEASLAIREILYVENNDRWVEDYTSSLNNLAYSFKSIGRTTEAIVLEETALSIRERFYQENKKRWAEGYSTSLNNLAASYSSVGRTGEAITLDEASLAIRETLYAENNDRWAEDYTTSLNNLAISYGFVDRTTEAITLLETSLAIRETLYLENNDRWSEDYHCNLNNLAFSYKAVNRTAEAIPLQKAALVIAEKLYTENKDRWVKYYRHYLYNLADSYETNNQITEALNLYKKLKVLAVCVNEENNSEYTIQILRMLNKLTEYSIFDELALQHQLELKEKIGTNWVPHNSSWLLCVWGNSYHERGLSNQAMDKFSQAYKLIQEYKLEDFEVFDELIHQYVLS